MLDSNDATVGVLLLELQIPDAQSLKIKRKSIKSFKERVQTRFKISIAEVGSQDSWQRSVIGVTMISNDAIFIQKQFQAILQILELYPELVLLDSHQEFL